MGLLDRPSEPGQPGRAERGDRAERAGQLEADRARPEAREAHDPDERSRAYEAIRAHVAADTPDRAGPAKSADASGQRSYWAEVPRFQAMWAEHEKRWPADRQPAAAADRPPDPPGSYRSDGGFYLNPERHAEASEAIARIRKAEPAISADAQSIERENKHGGWLEGFKHRLKGDDRLKEKVAERLEGEPDKTPTEVLHKVPDAIRYTYCLRPEIYSRGYYDFTEQLESRGYQMYESRGSWDGAEYKGINTRWVTPEGRRFEVQIHTPESYHSKEDVTHRAYERIRNPLVSDGERAELKAFQREVCSHIQIPEGAKDIPDFKREGF